MTLWKHPECRVVVAMLGLLALSEGAMRLMESRLSKDVAHLKQFPRIARDLAEHPADQSRILFLGNSLTRYGVDVEVFQEEIHRYHDAPVQIAKVVPDNSQLADWSYAYHNFFHAAKHPPELLVIGFGFGNQHLADRPSSHPERLARYYCTLKDLDELCKWDLPDIESRLDYVVASGSVLYANRDRVQRWGLDRIIPEYRDGIQTLNDLLQASAPKETSHATFHRLRALVEEARQDAVRVVLMALPVGFEYEFDPEFLRLTAELQVPVIDCRNVPGVTRSQLFDGLHLDPDGAKLVTRHLARELRGRVGDVLTARR
jgi:hypothetical protein